MQNPFVLVLFKELGKDHRGGRSLDQREARANGDKCSALRKIYFEGKVGRARLLFFLHRKPIHKISLLRKTLVTHTLAWVPSAITPK